MKQHDTYPDEALYQQMMAELQAGADEYDTLLAARKRATAKQTRKRLAIRYAAAACLVFAISAVTLLRPPLNPPKGGLPHSADISSQGSLEAQNVLTENMEEVQNAQLEYVPERDVPQVNKVLAQAPAKHQVDMTTPNMEEPAPLVEDDTDIDISDQELLYALITEVEAKAMAEQAEEERLYRTLLEEISTNISKETTQTELTL